MLLTYEHAQFWASPPRERLRGGKGWLLGAGLKERRGSASTHLDEPNHQATQLLQTTARIS